MTNIMVDTVYNGWLSSHLSKDLLVARLAYDLFYQ